MNIQNILCIKNNRGLVLNNNVQPKAGQTQLATPEQQALSMLTQAFQIVEHQDKAVQEEYNKTIQQFKQTVAKLESSQLALIQQNSQKASENVILQSQKRELTAA